MTKDKAVRPLARQLKAQFTRGCVPLLCAAGAVTVAAGTLDLIVSWIMQQLIDAASGAPGALPIGVLARISGVFMLLCAAIFVLQMATRPRYIERALRQYRSFAMEKLLEKNIASFRQAGTADYLSALTNDVTVIENDYLAQRFTMLEKGITFIGALALMLWYSPLMTAIAAGLTLLPFIASLPAGDRLQTAEKTVSAKNRDLTAALNDLLGGFAVVKSFQAERRIWRLFTQSDGALEREKCRRCRLKALIGAAGAIAGLAAQLGVFLIGAYRALTGQGLTAGAVILFVDLMDLMIEPVAALPGLLSARRAALALVDKLADALEQKAPPTAGLPLTAVRQSIRLEDVSFSYDGERPVLQGITAEFTSGKAYAIVGGSGSGRSTLFSLLTGENSNFGGQILIDGIPIRDIDPAALYDVMGTIAQNVFVFNASVRDNVTMFRDLPPEDTADALRRAHLSALLTQRGEGYLCGEGGSGLSGGERQRIAIARCLLKRSSVLLADEATAALDAETAHEVAEDLLSLSGMTRIIVTHTLERSLLSRYDGILVLRGGRIEECGTFDELMAKKGYFYALVTVAD